MMNNLAEAVQLLNDSGILKNLHDDAQSTREEERTAIYQRLVEAEKAEAERCAKLAETRAALQLKIDRDEASLKASRADLAQIEQAQSGTINRLRGQMRKLSDPVLARALFELSDLFDTARQGFHAGRGVVRSAVGKSKVSISNSLEVAERLASIRTARLQIEAMQELPRPADLPEKLENLLRPIRESVRKH